MPRAAVLGCSCWPVSCVADRSPPWRAGGLPLCLGTTSCASGAFPPAVTTSAGALQHCSYMAVNGWTGGSPEHRHCGEGRQVRGRVAPRRLRVQPPASASHPPRSLAAARLRRTTLRRRPCEEEEGKPCEFAVRSSRPEDSRARLVMTAVSRGPRSPGCHSGRRCPRAGRRPRRRRGGWRFLPHAPRQPPSTCPRPHGPSRGEGSRRRAGWRR